MLRGEYCTWLILLKSRSSSFIWSSLCTKCLYVLCFEAKIPILGFCIQNKVDSGYLGYCLIEATFKKNLQLYFWYLGQMLSWDGLARTYVSQLTRIYSFWKIWYEKNFFFSSLSQIWNHENVLVFLLVGIGEYNIIAQQQHENRAPFTCTTMQLSNSKWQF